MLLIVYHVFGCVMEFLSRVSFIEKLKDLFSKNFSALERNQVDEFFTQSSLTPKPVVK
jgi:hypothetical protein